jgi:hypothetical protein
LTRFVLNQDETRDEELKDTIKSTLAKYAEVEPAQKAAQE